MTTIIKIGFQHYAIKKSANVAALLKILQEGVPVRTCYSAERPVRFRTYHNPREIADIEVTMVDDRQVGPADPGFDDRGEPIEKPVRRGRLLPDSATS